MALKMLELNGNTVHVKDRERVNKILDALELGGPGKLQVIADFDFTLSCLTYKGERCVSCHKALDDSPHLPNAYREQAYALRNHYYPLEIHPTLTMEQKFPLMVEWWTQSHRLLIDYKLNRQTIREIVQESRLILRDGCHTFFDSLHQHQVPLLIFSAGLGDIIHEAITHQAHLHDNMKIVANFMKFDSKGELLGFQDELIHSLNKNLGVVQRLDSDYFQLLSTCDNVILLGDNIGDLKMVEGMSHTKNILKIGFLNDKVEERLGHYKEAFDIVLVNDETIDIPNAILQRIFREV